MANSKQGIWLRAAGLCGVMTPIIVLPLILLSILYSPWFNWAENALSDLGVHEAAVLFNSSLMIGGILALIFATGLAQTMRQSRVGLIGPFLLILASISLFAIGLFPETAGPIHLYVSISFFALGALSMLFTGAALIMDSTTRKIGALSLVTGLFAAAVWIAFWNLPVKGVAIPETLAALAASVWAAVMGIRLFKQASKT